MFESSQGMYAVVFFVLVLTAAGFAAAYYTLQSEATEMRGQHGALLGMARLLSGLIDEVCASWVGMPEREEDGEELLALARTVAQCMPKLLSNAGARVRHIGLQRYKFTQDDFVAAGLAKEYSQVPHRLATLDEPALSQLWESRRMLDLMSMLRFIQPRLCLSGSRTPNPTEASSQGNPLLSMLREEADAAVICAAMGEQIQLLNAGAEPTDPNPQGEQALQAIVEALSFRRNGLGKPFTFAVLVLALSGRGLEELYRECRHDAETVNGSWRPQFNGLRSYIESLPGWDGRLPFADMMVATHNSYVSRALSVLMRVS